MQPGPLARQQVGVDGLAGERVPEGVRVALTGDEELPPDRLAQRRLQLVLRQSDGVAQQLVLDAPPGDGGGTQHLLGGVGQLLEADQENVGEPAGYPARLRVGGGEQLLRIEGVALGPLDDPPHGRVRQRLLAQGTHQPGHLGVGHRPQLQPFHGGQPHQLRQQRAQRMTSMEVVRAVRREHREPVAGRAARRPLEHAPAEQEPQQIPRGLVGPVQVLQDEQQGSELGDSGQQPGHPLEQPQPPTGVPRPVRRPATEQPPDHGMRGKGPGEPLVGGQHPQDLGERQIRQADVTEIDTVPREHGHTVVRGPPGGLRQHPCLAHPGVPGDEHGTGLTDTGAIQHTGETGQLVVTADEWSVEQVLRHR